MGVKERMFEMLTLEFREYASWTKQTAIYTNKEQALMCCLLGLGGESVELQQHKLYSVDNEDLLKKEYGDIFWYIGQLSYNLGIVDAIEIYEIIDGFTEAIEYVGQIQEQFKKVIRDDNFDFDSSPRKERIIELISEFLSFLYTEITDVEGYDFIEIIETNKAKLTSRLQRGVISGSGDNR